MNTLASGSMITNKSLDILGDGKVTQTNVWFKQILVGAETKPMIQLSSESGSLFPILAAIRFLRRVLKCGALASKDWQGTW